MLETARELGAREFVRHVQQQSELYDLLTAGDSGPYTIFVPTDEAFAVISQRDFYYIYIKSYSIRLAFTFRCVFFFFFVTTEN